MMEPLVILAYDLATLVVQLVIGISIPLLAINIARGAAGAQIANAVGSYVGVSQAWMNIIGAVLVFAIAALCPIVIGMVADALQQYVITEIVLPRWGGGGPQSLRLVWSLSA
jgi:hypothetical protein